MEKWKLTGLQLVPSFVLSDFLTREFSYIISTRNRPKKQNSWESLLNFHLSNFVISHRPSRHCSTEFPVPLWSLFDLLLCVWFVENSGHFRFRFCFSTSRSENNSLSLYTIWLLSSLPRYVWYTPNSELIQTEDVGKSILSSSSSSSEVCWLISRWSSVENGIKSVGETGGFSPDFGRFSAFLGFFVDETTPIFASKCFRLGCFLSSFTFGFLLFWCRKAWQFNNVLQEIGELLEIYTFIRLELPIPNIWSLIFNSQGLWKSFWTTIIFEKSSLMNSDQKLWI